MTIMFFSDTGGFAERRNDMEGALSAPPCTSFLTEVYGTTVDMHLAVAPVAEVMKS
jgi:hypothetical protein